MKQALHCPSAQPDWQDNFVFGIVRGTARDPEVEYLAQPLALTAELREIITEPVELTEMLRFAAPCVGSACAHFRGHECTLVQRIVNTLPGTGALPACIIRDVCRWYAQEGSAACLRCQHVVTDQMSFDPAIHAVAMPPQT